MAKSFFEVLERFVTVINLSAEAVLHSAKAGQNLISFSLLTPLDISFKIIFHYLIDYPTGLTSVEKMDN